MTNTLTALEKYFRGIAPFKDFGLESVRSNYKWKLPKSSFDGKPLDIDGTNFEANIKLKFFLNKIWHSEPHSRQAIVKWIISDWGGIRGNKQQTLDAYYIASLEENPQTPLKGIASFSKVLAIKEPFRYAIYDARVAVSLNAIQMIGKVSDGNAFPYLPGRNNITGNWDPSAPRGFSKSDITSITTLVSSPRNWRRVSQEETYHKYLSLMGELAQKLSAPVYHLEMTLFSQAEMLACLIIPPLKLKI